MAGSGVLISQLGNGVIVNSHGRAAERARHFRVS